MFNNLFSYNLQVYAHCILCILMARCLRYFILYLDYTYFHKFLVNELLSLICLLFLFIIRFYQITTVNISCVYYCYHLEAVCLKMLKS